MFNWFSNSEPSLFSCGKLLLGYVF
jgi:hypothetical protein